MQGIEYATEEDELMDKMDGIEIEAPGSCMIRNKQYSGAQGCEGDPDDLSDCEDLKASHV